MEAQRNRTILIAALAVAAMFAAATPAVSDTPIWSCTASGSSVTVTLHNGSLLPLSTTLTVSALTATGAQSRAVAVTVAPLSSAKFSVGFTSTVKTVSAVAISDDATPF